MKHLSRPYRLLSWLTVPVVIFATALMVDLLLHPLETGFSANEAFWSRWLYGFVFAAVNIFIGLWCMRRARGNVIGPLLVIYGAGLTTQSLRASFDPLFGAVIFFIGGSFGWIGFFILVLLFPDGRPYPRWMRWYILALLLALAFYGLTYLLGSPVYSIGPDDAPLALVANPNYFPILTPLHEAFNSLIQASLLPATIIALPLSVIMRYRAASALERAQIRWILWGMLVMLLAMVAQLFADSLGLADIGNSVGAAATILVFTLPPFAIGNAILRHKLYDIDIIIRRTLIYSVLTAVLAAIYFGGVVLAQQVFKAATGESSDLAIVVSTLLIAALFTPLRRRIQQVIDRRFYRHKYDAEQTLARFNQSLRDEVDIETLQAQMVAVVQETMQPRQLALWLKDDRA